jgi:hypothetical protein
LLLGTWHPAMDMLWQLQEICARQAPGAVDLWKQLGLSSNVSPEGMLGVHLLVFTQCFVPLSLVCPLLKCLYFEYGKHMVTATGNP